MTVTEPTTAELRATMLELGARAHELRTMPADKRGDTYEADIAEVRLAVFSLDPELRAREAADRELQEWADAVERSKGPLAGMADLEGAGRARDMGSQVANSEEYRNWLEGGAEYRNFPQVEVRTLITSSESDTSAAGVLRPEAPPIAPIPRQRRLFIRDLLSTGTTNYGVALPYIRELNPATNETGATAVPEGSAKPEATMSFVQATANVVKIAAWVPATMEILADAPTLTSYINARLVYMVQIREEADLLRGVPSGTNPTVEGIYTVTGTQSQSVVQSDTRDDALRTLAQAIGKVENVDGTADGIAMNPLDYWAMVSSRFGTGSTGAMDAPNPWAGPPGTVWGLPVVRTRALLQTDAIVADWRGGGQVFDRMAITVRTSDSHDDYFVKNKVAILAEKRLAFAIYRPDYFVLTEIETPGA